MARPRARRTIKNPGAKVSRRIANKHKKKVNIVSNPIIAKNWDKKKTLRQNYEKLGLMSTLNGVAGSREIKPLIEPVEKEELSEADMEELERSLGPDEGLIQRDDQGNVIRVIIGKEKTLDEVVGEEIKPVKAKTEVVKALEAHAANGRHVERHQSKFEENWLQQLIGKHGDDYEAMFWDKRLNIYQQTAAELRKKVLAYVKKHKK
ncbi:ribosome biogenesis protein Nop16 [Endogone sp. FLAS-F59071]|nr:ribosome biogenesis protein Nop16 [Endogone sp. FLAS-F59071]|eukprot:RUS18063.1 ribosome biogenesis protein Nop16 [Endogone sp. FLAS-F59071]